MPMHAPHLAGHQGATAGYSSSCDGVVAEAQAALARLPVSLCRRPFLGVGHPVCVPSLWLSPHSNPLPAGMPTPTPRLRIAQLFGCL